VTIDRTSLRRLWELVAEDGDVNNPFRVTLIGSIPSLLDEIDRLELRLQVATELNVGDRKQISALEAERDVLTRDLEIARSLTDPGVAEHFNRERYRLIGEVAKLRTELGEAKLVIEQQDRDLEKLRTALGEALHLMRSGRFPAEAADRLRKVLG
jgi:hypothetical protein